MIPKHFSPSLIFINTNLLVQKKTILWKNKKFPFLSQKNNFWSKLDRKISKLPVFSLYFHYFFYFSPFSSIFAVHILFCVFFSHMFVKVSQFLPCFFFAPLCPIQFWLFFRFSVKKRKNESAARPILPRFAHIFL